MLLHPRGVSHADKAGLMTTVGPSWASAAAGLAQRGGAPAVQERAPTINKVQCVRQVALSGRRAVRQGPFVADAASPEHGRADSDDCKHQNAANDAIWRRPGRQNNWKAQHD